MGKTEMTTLYRQHEIQISCDHTKAYFTVFYPNGAKMTSGFFKLSDSLVAKYQELRSQIDSEIDQ